MPQRSNIHGTEYTFLERIPSLDNDKQYILCADSVGNRFICSENLWNSGTLPENSALVTTHSSAQEKIDFFLALFRGRPDLYAKRYYSVKAGKSGYTPVCRNEWQMGLCDKKKYRCPNCPNRNLWRDFLNFPYFTGFLAP